MTLIVEKETLELVHALQKGECYLQSSTNFGQERLLFSCIKCRVRKESAAADVGRISAVVNSGLNTFEIGPL